MRGTPNIELALRQPIAGPRRPSVGWAPPAEIPIDGDNFLLRASLSQREGWRNVTHPNVIDRRFDHADIGTSSEFALRLVLHIRAAPAREPARTAQLARAKISQK
jgi:hypothetical protein